MCPFYHCRLWLRIPSFHRLLNSEPVPCRSSFSSSSKPTCYRLSNDDISNNKKFPYIPSQDRINLRRISVMNFASLRGETCALRESHCQRKALWDSHDNNCHGNGENADDLLNGIGSLLVLLEIHCKETEEHMQSVKQTSDHFPSTVLTENHTKTREARRAGRLTKQHSKIDPIPRRTLIRKNIQVEKKEQVNNMSSTLTYVCRAKQLLFLPTYNAFDMFNFNTVWREWWTPELPQPVRSVR